MKKIVLALCLLMFVNSLQAQTPPMPPSISNDWRGSGEEMNNDQAFLDGLLIRSRKPSIHTRESVENPPLTPATLLLLGLGSVAVGGTVYRNTKKRQ